MKFNNYFMKPSIKHYLSTGLSCKAVSNSNHKVSVAGGYAVIRVAI